MQVYFLFLESLGTPEMILIALVALIIFGPRKLPQIGRTIGKYTAEFKRASRDFRDTFEREVQMAELEEKQASPQMPSSGGFVTNEDSNAVENTIGRRSARSVTTDDNGVSAPGANLPIANLNENLSADLNENHSVALPEIRSVNQNDLEFQPNSNENKTAKVAAALENAENLPRRKREWL